MLSRGRRRSRPPATRRFLAAPRPKLSRSFLASPRVADPPRARRGWPPRRHGDAVTTRRPRLAPASRLDRLEPPLELRDVPDLPSHLLSSIAPLRAPPFAWNGRCRHHGRRRPIGSRGAPSSGLPRAHSTPQLASSPSAGTPRPTRRRPSPPERRRRKPSPPPAAPLRGAVASDLLPANQGHPEVRLSPLYLFPNLAPTAGASPRRILARPPSSVLQPARDSC